MKGVKYCNGEEQIARRKFGKIKSKRREFWDGVEKARKAAETELTLQGVGEK